MRRTTVILLVLVASVALFLISRGKWSDPIVDSGIEWAYADSLARGQLLYRDVVYWFGPLTPYFQSLFLRALGSSFRSLAAAGVAGSLLTLAALAWALRRVCGRTEALLWTALAVPALVFMPNAGGSILGMGYRIWHPATFSLLAVGVASRGLAGGWIRRALLVGLLCACAGLSRTEWGLMALAASVVALALAREGRGRGGWVRAASAACAAAAAAYFAVLGLLAAAAGRQAVFGSGSILLTGVAPETRRFLVAFSGVREWPRGLAELFYSAAVWGAAVLFCVAIASRPRTSTSWRPLVAWFAALAAVLIATAMLHGANGAVAFSAAPLVGLLGVAAGLRRRGRPRGAALGGFGVLAILASHRRPFHIGDSAYTGPALLFAFVCAAGLVHGLVVARRGSRERRRLARVFQVAVGALCVLAFLGRAWQYHSDDRVWISGTGQMLSASPATAAAIVATADAVRSSTAPGDALVVFPEGQVLNALSARPDPLRQKLYIPGYLTAANEEDLLADLRRKRPRAVVLWRRPTDEYGPSEFGVDYGRRVFEWIQSEYALAQIPSSPSSHGLARLYLLRSPAQPLGEAGHDP